MFGSVGEIKDGMLRIGNTSVPVYAPETKMKVPDVLFYENAQVKLYTGKLLVIILQQSVALHVCRSR